MLSAMQHTKKADTPATKKQWAATANAVLRKTNDEAAAIKIANADAKKHPAKAPPKATPKPPARMARKPPVGMLSKAKMNGLSDDNSLPEKSNLFKSKVKK